MPLPVTTPSPPVASEWDTFLQSAPGGEFYQTSAFARIKEMDSWRVSRVLLHDDGVVQAGFQLTFRPTRFGPIGYVSRGPVLRQASPSLASDVLDALIEKARALRLRALLVHPPADGPPLEAALRKRGFLPNRLSRVITATALIDLRQGLDAVRSRFNRSKRAQIRRAAQRGITIRQGTVGDLGVFFSLMLESCRRQQSSPNPSSATMLVELYQALGRIGTCRLTFADLEGQPVAGLFSIGFNNRLSIWKKGARSEFLHLDPDPLLYDETFAWAASKGYTECDFCAMNRSMAEKLISGIPLSPEDLHSRYAVLLHLGGASSFLPEAMVLFPNPFLRLAYRWFLVNPVAAKVLRRFYYC